MVVRPAARALPQAAVVPVLGAEVLQIRAAAEQANFETFMLRQEMRRGK